MLEGNVFISSLSSLSFLFPFSSLSLSFISSYYLIHLFSPFLRVKTQNNPQGLMSRLTPIQSIIIIIVIIIVIMIIMYPSDLVVFIYS